MPVWLSLIHILNVRWYEERADYSECISVGDLHWQIELLSLIHIYALMVSEITLCIVIIREQSLSTFNEIHSPFFWTRGRQNILLSATFWQVPQNVAKSLWVTGNPINLRSCSLLPHPPPVSYTHLECENCIMASCHEDYLYEVVSVEKFTYKNYRYHL